MFRCARCRVEVRLCSLCDRGQRYCGAECSAPSRRDSCLEAGRRYQQTECGRRANAKRQKEWRNREIERQQNPTVTHQGSPTLPLVAEADPLPQLLQEDLHVELLSSSSSRGYARANFSAIAAEDTRHRCTSCGRVCSGLERFDFQRRRTGRRFRC